MNHQSFQNPIQAQINSVLQSFPGSSLINQSTIEIPIQLPAGILKIQVRLNGYPQQPPQLVTCSRVHHPMVGPDQSIEYPHKNQWNPRVGLAEIVSVVVQTFATNVPVPAAAVAQAQAQEQNQRSRQSDTFEQSFSDIMSSMKEGEIRDILANDSEILFLVHRFPEIQSLLSEKRHLLQMNAEIAKESLQFRPQIEHLTNELNSKVEEVTDQKELLEVAMSQQAEVGQKIGRAGVHAELMSRKTTLAEEYSKINENLMSGSISIDEYMETYFEKRKEANLAENLLNLIPS